MIVVLAEKPSVARDIAQVLGARSRRDGYLEGNGYIVTWAFGHLVQLAEPDDYDSRYKRWSVEDLPIVPDSFKLKISSGNGVKKQFQIIKQHFKSADSIICATDAGREGELIFRYIQQMCQCQRKPCQRLWISSLTDTAIREGLNNLRPLKDFDRLAAAARCRSQADWIVGLNATRGYTVKHSHGRGVLSIGRVQTPVLSMIVQRDETIQNFNPEDYWELWTVYRDVRFKHKADRFKKEADAQSLLDKVESSPFCIQQIDEKKASLPPPQLFDLTELQRTMNRLHGFPAKRSLEIAQSLYERKAISYPRTDSRYLSDDIYPECSKILKQLSSIRPEEIAQVNLSSLPKSKRFFNSGKVTDHTAIIPTGQRCSLEGREEQIVYHAIVTRFIAIFYPNCEKLHTTVFGDAASENFKAKGTRIVKAGWFALYQSEKREKKDEEQVLPQFQSGEQGPHVPEVKKCQTKPPKHYTEGTLLSAMETAGKTVDDEALREALKDKGLGTPATRASIIETLVKREYISKAKKTLLATDKGRELIKLLKDDKTLGSAEMTAEWESQLKQIEKGEIEATQFMEQIQRFTKASIDTLVKGAEVSSSNLGSCPLCQSPVIQGKTGYGCSAWKSGCSFRFHAEQFGTTLKCEDVHTLLHRGKTTYPRTLNDPFGSTVKGYICMDKEGALSILTQAAKQHANSLGACPLCSSAVIENSKAYSCCACSFVIWKTIASKKISAATAQVLMSKRQTRTLKGFRSKAGKPFEASLILKDGKVSFNF
jgi:DNA topoisomerase-3